MRYIYRLYIVCSILYIERYSDIYKKYKIYNSKSVY